MKPLIISLLGENGQLGRTIKRDWQTGEHANQFAIHGFDLPELDITKKSQLDEKLAGLNADVVINAAAYTAVDKAESEQELAYKVNRDGARLVAEWAKKNQARLLHISTDFVFDGKSSREYMPEDPTGPVNVYGASKLAGEQAVLEAYGEGSIIIRTSWLYSPYQSNFVKTMLRLMGEKEQLRVVNDQIGTPTSSHSLTECLALAATSETASGIFHWSDDGAASWYDFAVAIQEEALAVGLLEKAISIEPINSDQFPTPAVRPAFSVLDKTLTYKSFGCDQVHWRDRLQTVIHELATMVD